MHAEMAEDSTKQTLLNHRMAALESARREAIEQGTSEPPPLHELPLQAMAGGEEEVTRVWDTGATAGMTKPGSSKGFIRKARTARVTTRAGVVKTNGSEDLGHGVMLATWDSKLLRIC